MVIQVNPTLCAGCGECMDVCPEGAIHLVDQRAVIDNTLCTGCGACVEACPNEAITAHPILEPEVSAITLPAVQSGPILVQEQANLPLAASPARGLAPLAGAALTFLGTEVAPRLVDVLVNALDRKLAQPKMTAAPTLTVSPKMGTNRRNGQKRQARYRGGRIRNHSGRR